MAVDSAMLFGQAFDLTCQVGHPHAEIGHSGMMLYTRKLEN